MAARGARSERRAGGRCLPGECQSIFVLAVWCFDPSALPQLALGFAAPCTVAALWLWQQGAPAYYEEV
jgi:hypothetical protein